jgi:hypothetical protein
VFWYFAVVPLPVHLHEAVLGLDDEDDLELARDWIRDGNYVLHCVNAFDMSATGEVESS